MGDFLLDFQSPEKRALRRATALLKFFPDLHVTSFEEPEFSLVLTSPDQPDLWGPFRSPDGNVIVALCGRIALEQKEWDAAQRVEGAGGLACKFIYRSYCANGVAGTEALSGNFVVCIFDRTQRKFWLVTDRHGLFPAFKHDQSRPAVFSSHPDALADATGERGHYDLTSFAEFILTARLTAPFTYYERIKALPQGSVTTLALDDHGVANMSTRPYFEFRFRPEPVERLDELAEELAAGFQKSLTKRTLPVVGKSAVALSGGLDSRTVLCAAPERKNLLTFCCYDEENYEFKTARAIAHAAGVEFVPLRRESDYYADNAVLGARISGGMGCIASNHFLGFRQELAALGVKNLLTGCYCDYLFKGLALNKRVNRWTTLESAGQFDFPYYSAHFTANTTLAAAVRERLEKQIPREVRAYDTEERMVDVETRRLFPLWYEEDNAERTIPQRVMGWYVPVAENDLLSVQQKMTTALKLNRRLFTRMAQRVCTPEVLRVPNANTGTAVGASPLTEAIHSHIRRAQGLLQTFRPSVATTGSWLNWEFYVNHSGKVRSLWNAPNPEADEIFTQCLGKDGYSKDISTYHGDRLSIFLQLFTLKLWLNQC